jgi:hypothetical protein
LEAKTQLKQNPKGGTDNTAKYFHVKPVQRKPCKYKDL